MLRVAVLAEDGAASASTRYRALQHVPRLTERLATSMSSFPKISRHGLRKMIDRTASFRVALSAI